MKPITKKRFNGYLIDHLAISTAVTAGVEHFLRKKVKNEAVHNIVMPMVVMWALEYAQLRQFGQTAGYKASGLAVTAKDGNSLTSGQIVKRMVYGDTLSTFDYMKNRSEFEGENGEVFPHDRYAGTVVREP